jgi:hypothetical protein
VRLALDDGGRFLDVGETKRRKRMTSSELFGLTAGLVWQLAGERVEAIGADHVRSSDGRTIARNQKGPARG